MRIGVDIDGVLADMVTPLDVYHNKKYGTNVSLRDHSTYNLGTVWGCSFKESMDRCFEFYFSDAFHTTKPIYGSKLGINRLAHKHDLFIITSRPHDLEERSNAWIHKHFPNKFKGAFHTNQIAAYKGQSSKKKSAICKEQGITTVIEDHIDYANDCASENIRTILFTAPWNKKIKELHPLITRVHSWNEIPSLLT